MGLDKFKQYEKGNKFYAAEIMSTPYLKERYSQTGQGTFHMILTHIVQQDEEYASHYEQEKGLKLLDNSLFELGYALPPEQVMEAAGKVGADILVAPDVIRDGKATYENALKFVEQLKQQGDIKYAIMAVPQGDTVEEWVECYERLVEIPEIQCIGLSIIGMITSMQGVTGTDDIVTNRLRFVEYLNEKHIWKKDKWHHLLGLGRGAFELAAYGMYDFIRSNDSSNAWWHGHNDILYKPFGILDEKLPLEVDFSAKVNFNASSAEHNLLVQRGIVDMINEIRKVKVGQ